MIYLTFQAHSDIMEPVRVWARTAVAALGEPWIGLSDYTLARNFAAVYELLARAKLTHERPAFGINTVKVGEREVEVREEAVYTTPFGTLLHFRKDIEMVQPRVLLVAPLSGHFATLLRDTVRTMLPEHDVYLTDWHNARDISLSDGQFGFDDYIDHVIRFLETLGPGTHLVAVCQPCVAALAAVAIMAEAGDSAQPRSMTLMAGPVDTRVNPTKVNELATGRPIKWFDQNFIARVPSRFRGTQRRVYPGFVQLASFMSLNLGRHVKAHLALLVALANGDHEKAKATKAFYDEYFAVMDMPAEFFCETVRLVFQEHALPLGRLEWRGRRVNPRAIRRTALLTVEGERDYICAVGQTVAAHDLCSSLRPYMKRHHLQAGVGHYGVFSGTRWVHQIYPVLKNIILASD
jgi:polyhydroxyalkanoate depolymerase